MLIGQSNKSSIIGKATQWVINHAPGFSLEGFKIINGISYAIVRSKQSSNEVRHIDSHVFMAN
ncbi:MAG: hypothetical protein H8D97_01230 [Proteobacteria bacterium]|nr:hypothetical protein [Pseudomonadota bacterium]